MKKSIFTLSILSIFLLASCGKKADLQINSEPQEVVSQEAEKASLKDGVYDLTAGQTLNWEAFKAVGGHAGTVALKSGELSIEGGMLKSGVFVVDMTSIMVDPAEGEMGVKVAEHLMADDFFSSDKYAESRFEVSKVNIYDGDEDYDYRVEGFLTVKEVTAPVTVSVKLEQTGDTVNIHATSAVDRTDFGITFRSGSFFQDLGDTLIKDIFNMEMHLIAVPRA